MPVHKLYSCIKQLGGEEMEYDFCFWNLSRLAETTSSGTSKNIFPNVTLSCLRHYICWQNKSNVFLRILNGFIWLSVPDLHWLFADLIKLVHFHWGRNPSMFCWDEKMFLSRLKEEKSKKIENKKAQGDGWKWKPGSKKPVAKTLALFFKRPER